MWNMYSRTIGMSGGQLRGTLFYRGKWLIRELFLSKKSIAGKWECYISWLLIGWTIGGEMEGGNLLLGASGKVAKMVSHPTFLVGSEINEEGWR